MLHVVIVSYCTWPDLEKTVQSIESSRGVDFQLHIVDNLGDDEVKLMVNKRVGLGYYRFGNVGYGQGFNRFLSVQDLDSSDLFIVSNDDVLVESDTLVKMVEAHALGLKRYTQVGPVSPNYLRLDGAKGVDFEDGLESTEEGVAKIQFSPAAFWLLDYKFLKEVGGFVPDFFMYGEDRELAYRSVNYSYQPLKAKGALVRHNFDYPPRDMEKRVLLEKNVLCAQYLKVEHNKSGELSWYVMGALLALVRFDFKGFRAKRMGYESFLKHKTELTLSKEKISNKDLKFRFIPGKETS